MNETLKTERARGRPADIQSGELESRILDVAENLISEQGFTATSIRQIADQASVNPALIHYYFKSKKGLLIAVMNRTLLPMAEAIGKMKSSDSVSIEKFASLFFNMACKHPSMPKLMVREVMMSAGDTHDLFIKNYAPHLGGALPGLLGKEKAAGRLRLDADLPISALLILAICVFPFIARSLAEPVLGVKFDDDGMKTLHQQISALLSEGIAR